VAGSSKPIVVRQLERAARNLAKLLRAIFP
jgi:hypothetical protein